MVSISGLGSGLDTQSIIQQLVAIEQQKIANVQARGTAEQTALSSWTTIRSALSTLNTAEQALVRASNWQLLTATSSDTDTATVNAGSGTMTGSLTFSVTSLAQSGSLRSTNTLASLSDRVTTASSILTGSGGGKLGLSSIASNSSVSLGTHTIAVTQSSAAATKTATAPLAASTVIDGTNNALQLAVNGTTYNLTIASGTYSAQQLAAAVQQALTTAGAAASASANSSGTLSLATTSEGSAATVRVTGGTALTPLHLTIDGSVIRGSDALVTVDGGAAQTFGNTSALTAGGTITLSAGSGTITATLAGGLRAGTMTANNVSTGDGSLQSVVAAINGANAGVSAAAIQVGTNSYRLQISAANTGAGNDPNIASSVFDPTVVGGLTVLSQGTDASITVGSGPGAYTITSSTNTLANVMPGVSVTVLKQSTAPVTVSVARDGNALANSVQKLVDAANAAMNTLDNASKYDASSRTASPLTGDGTLERLRRGINNAITNVVSGANPTSPGLAGVSVDKNGDFTFDKAAFNKAYAADPAGVSKLFAQSASSTSGSLSLVSATNQTRGGTYAVNITRAATQATAQSAGLPAVGTTIRARVGSVVAAYTVQAGDTVTTVTAGLNSAFAAQNLGLVASVNGTNVKIDTARYGALATMDVAWNGTSYNTSTGVDVAGTINGVAATGIGQALAAPPSDPTLAGLTIQVTGTATGALGTFSYTPGIAARLDTVIEDATDSLTGYISSAEKARKANQKLISDQVDRMTTVANAYQDRLKAQFAQLESVLATMKNTSSFLSAQISTL